jgi:HEAT repeat protein
VQDAVDIGADALEQILKFIGGETEREGNKPNAATRYFVAEAAAKVIEKYNVGNGVELLRNALLSGDNDAKKTGGAIGLGFLPKDKVTGGEREALTRSLAGSNDVKEASANALAKVGDDSSAADLTKTAAEENLAVALASLRALFYTKPKNPDTVRALGDMIADEPAAGGAGSKKSREKYVREYAADALGEIGDPAAIAHLLRARRDDMKNVRDAATLAIQKISKIDAAGASKTCLEVLKDETKKTDDRIGAALSLGDMGDPALGKELSLRIIDPNPPRVLRDPDSGVRSKICEALGNMGDGAKKKTIVENLLRAMGDEGEREGPRDKAYEALKRISGLDPDKEGSADAAKKFKGSDPKPNREGAVKSWVEWFNGAGLSD